MKTDDASAALPMARVRPGFSVSIGHEAVTTRLLSSSALRRVSQAEVDLCAKRGPGSPCP